MLVLLAAGVCIGLWWLLKLRKPGAQESETDKDKDSDSTSWLSSPDVYGQVVESETSRTTKPAAPTEHCVQSVDANAPSPRLVIPESAPLVSFGEISVEIRDPEQGDQPAVSDSQLSTEGKLKGIEIDPKDRRSCEAHVESQLSEANQSVDSVSNQDTSVQLASHLDVQFPVGGLITAADSIDQLTTNDEIAEGVGATAITRDERDESTAITDSRAEEKLTQTVSVLQERAASETLDSEVNQNEPATDGEESIDSSDVAEQGMTTTVSEQPSEIPTYRPLAPPKASVTAAPPRSRTATKPATNVDDLRLRLQLIFGRGGDVKLNLVADRREQMPDEVVISLAQGKLRLIRHQKDCYEAVSLLEVSSALQDGVEWQGSSGSTHFRWMLSRRELHVLAEGDVSGLYHFGSVARLQLNARHVLIATFSLRDNVLAALSDVGCPTPYIHDETTPGIPAGWLLFRNVIPTKAVPMREGADILNALCPLPEVETHFVGGIHLERSTWLLGYPPRIRLTGDLSSVEIQLGGQPASIGDDGTVTAEGWDTHGTHRLWLGGQTQNYTLRTIEENWQRWPAYDFGMGATICGASVDSNPSNRLPYQVIVQATNPLLIGATPGEVYYCHQRNGMRLPAYVTYVPFLPVWALPLDPAHAKRDSAQILMLDAIEPAVSRNRKDRRQSSSREIETWVSILNSASKKRLRIEPDSEESSTLWQCYRLAAKQLRRSLH
jgi:hypothetical protein